VKIGDAGDRNFRLRPQPYFALLLSSNQRHPEWLPWLQNHYVQNETGFVHICRTDLAGAREVPVREA
jgi:hypothetical protein